MLNRDRANAENARHESERYAGLAAQDYVTKEQAEQQRANAAATTSWATNTALRAGRPAVLGRVEGGRCLLDLRALPPAADAVLCAAVLACMS